MITGVPGDEEHAQKFQKWATTFIEAAKKKDAVPTPTSRCSRTSRRPRPASRRRSPISAPQRQADRRRVRAAASATAASTARRRRSTYPGRTSPSTEWAKLLDKLPSQRVAFVNTTSSSGAFLPAIAAPGRVVITATKTGGERNETQFPEFFVEAFSDPAADRDRNGHVSVARSVRVREDQGGAGVPAEGAAADRARGDGRRRRGPAGGGAVSRHRPRRGRAGGRHRRTRR